MSRSMSRSMRSTIGLVLTGALALTMGACTGQGETGSSTEPTAQPAPVAAAAETSGSAAVMARISNARYDEAVRDLLGVPPLSATLPADATETLTSETFEKYFDAADALSEQVWANPYLKARLLTCTPSADVACTRSLVTSIAARAWGGPVAPTDVERLTRLAVDAVAIGETPTDSIKQVVRTVLASPQFIYQVALAPQVAPSATSQL
jgi:Protein of unknown function (DUF1595)/Protein of unknown function (DUF1587)